MSQTNLPEPLQCPDSWKYDEEWSDGYQEKHGRSYLSKLCKHSGAGTEIMVFIYISGQYALTKIKTQNLFIKRFAERRIDITDFPDHEIDGAYSFSRWSHYLEEWEKLFEIYNARLAPPDILKILDEVKALIDAGVAHYEALMQFVKEQRAALAQRKEAEHQQAQMELMQQSRASKWEAIDVEHSKVTEGFVYLLSNALMPGVYKIGFTAKNPDRRASELSVQYGLPIPFEVIAYWRTKDPYIIEQRIHSALGSYSKAGEFFEVDLQLAKEIIEAHVMQP